MSYVINRYNGSELVVLQDGTLDTTTSLGLVGRNYVGYGTQQNENFLYLLENFANSAPPARPISGQTWFDTDNNSLNVYDGEKWHPVSTNVSDTAPANPTAGAIWLKTPVNQLYVYNGDAWAFIGPEAVEGFGITRPRSTTLIDSTSVARPVILFTVNDVIIAIASAVAFTIDPSNGILGFSNLVAGITISQLVSIQGDIHGVADRALQLEYARTINGVQFNGTQNINISASTPNLLKKGSYITGSDFNGSTEVTFAVDATPLNTIGKIVARNSQGGFAAGTITADLVGNVTGNITGTTGTFSIVTANEFRGATLTGNAYSASKLQTGRNINGVFFDGTEDITVTAEARTLTGDTINPGVTYSSLTQLGYLEAVSVQGSGGISVGNGITTAAKISVNGSTPTITGYSNLAISVADGNVLGGYATLNLLSSDAALTAGGEKKTTLTPELDLVWDLGIPSKRFNKVYSQNFYGDLTGNASSSTTSVTATNIAGGSGGAVPYQTASGTTTLLPPGNAGQTLQSAGSGNPPFWGTSFIHGMIMQWYGASNAVPEGWHVCDGTYGTPDLRNKFVVGAGGTYTMGAAGGSTTATNSSTISINGTTSTAGSHNHGGVTGDTSLTANQLPAHQHNFTDVYAIVGDYGLGGSTASTRDRNGTYIYPSFYAGNASDGDQDNGAYGFPSVTEATGQNQGHHHSIGTDGAHNHTVTVTAASGVISVDAVPPYVALFYIMKL